MSGEPNQKVGRFNRRTAIVVVIAAGVALLGLGALPWVKGSAAIPGAAVEQISSSGGQSAPLVPALGLVLLAAALALALARKIGVKSTSVVIAAAGAATTAVSVVVLNDPAEAMSAQVTEVTAILLPTEAISDVAITLWPAVSTVFGVAIIAIAVLIWRAAPQWLTDSRHEKNGADSKDLVHADADEIRDADLWDLLSDGQDPTP